MVPASFANYFMAMAGAGGALIGLLFVAISINPERMVGRAAFAEPQAVASSAFTALANGFFISAAGLLPGNAVIGPTAAVLASISLLNSALLAFRAMPPMYARARRTRRWHGVLAMAAMILISAVVYGDELANAIALVRNPKDTGPIFVLATLVLVVYGIALVRSWELLGAPRSGISGWLNPLGDLDADDGAAATRTEAVAATKPAVSAKDTAPTTAAKDAAAPKQP